MSLWRKSKHRVNRSSGAKQAAEKGGIPSQKPEKHTSGPEGRVDFAQFMPGLKPWPTARRSFSAACKGQAHLVVLTAQDPTQRVPRRPAVPFKAGSIEPPWIHGRVARLRFSVLILCHA